MDVGIKVCTGCTTCYAESEPKEGSKQSPGLLRRKARPLVGAGFFSWLLARREPSGTRLLVVTLTLLLDQAPQLIQDRGGVRMVSR